MKIREHAARDIESGLAGHAGAQQNRQQFRVGQCRSASVEQFLARTFAAGPVPNCHAPKHEVGHRWFT